MEYRKKQADVYVRASELKPKFGRNLPNSGEWTVHQVLELAKCGTDTDAKRAAAFGGMWKLHSAPARGEDSLPPLPSGD